ncbi:MAG: allophycocyanin [Acaryochloridaceae cyanobacterium RL_2_7]|nr:allophycocyanin [Acaryochloridaceae cyanobacterium RL_2_7]
MLKQLKQLVIDTEGRYATAEELAFIKDFLASSETRISIYEKIRDQEESLLDEFEFDALSLDESTYIVGTKNCHWIARRDCKLILRYLAISVLANSLERYRDGLLVWHRTIVKANRVQESSKKVRAAEYRVLEKNLSEEEFDYVKPALMLSQSLLQ